MACSTGEVLTAFRLTPDGCDASHYKMVYSCAATSGMEEVAAELSTSCGEAVNRGLHFFDRHDASCGSDQVMTNFRFVSSGCSNTQDRRLRFQCAAAVAPKGAAWAAWRQW